MSDVDIIIFAKDRLAQLDLLLRSLQLVGLGASVIVKISPELAENWVDMAADYPHFDWIDQDIEFHVSLSKLLIRKPYTWLLCDDDVVINKPNFNILGALGKDVAHMSTRLGPYVDYCYPLDHKHQSLNALGVPGRYPGYYEWKWKDMDAQSDLHYAASVSGAIWNTGLLRDFVVDSKAQNPNQLEDYICGRKLPPKLACFAHQCSVNIPMNLVQSTHRNRNSGVEVEQLNQHFIEGEQISIDHIMRSVTGESTFLNITSLEWEPRQ